jgi:arginine deiminase
VCPLELPGVRILQSGGDRYKAERERCDDCNNMLPIAPGVVGAYGRNVDSKPVYARPASRSQRSPALS